MLLAPVRMLFHTRFVLAAFLGWSVQWNSPQRDDDATPWSEAIRRHGMQTLLGIAWTLLVAWLNPRFLWWLSPIVGSLILSIPVSVISSRVKLGLRARDEKLFLIPEEYDTPRELRATDEYTSTRTAGMRSGWLPQGRRRSVAQRPGLRHGHGSPQPCASHRDGARRAYRQGHREGPGTARRRHAPGPVE